MSELRSAIAQLLEEGLSRVQISHRLGVAPSTVQHHATQLARPAVARLPAPPPAGAVRQVRTRERVGALLAEGLSKSEVAQRLGVSLGTVSYHAKRLGHPVDERGARRYDWSAVQAYYDEGHSVRECVAAFGFSHESWHAAKRRGDIVTRPRRMSIEELCVADAPRGRRYLRQRLVEAGLKEERCERCGIDSWLGAPLSLALHHVNGDRHDNRLENLELLCPNCHAQTDTFGRRKRAA